MLVLDAQLLVLLAVGATSRRLIEKKNTHQFDEDAFDLLEILLGPRSVRLLPNVVTDASNLL